MKDLYIVGAGGLGKDIVWLVERINQVQPTWDLKGFLDDGKMLNEEINGYKVLGGCEYLASVEKESWVVCAVANTKVRRKIIASLSKYLNIKFPVLIDPNVTLSSLVKIGEGSIICAGTIGTVNIEIGSFAIICLNCTLGHDLFMEDYVTVYPSVTISGNVYVEEGAELGTGTKIIQGKKIGKEAMIGAGSVVVKDVPAKCTAVGVPAKPIKFYE